MAERLVDVEIRKTGRIDLVVGVEGPNRLRVMMSPSECTQLILKMISALGATAQGAVDELQKWIDAG